MQIDSFSTFFTENITISPSRSEAACTAFSGSKGRIFTFVAWPYRRLCILTENLWCVYQIHKPMWRHNIIICSPMNEGLHIAKNIRETNGKHKLVCTWNENFSMKLFPVPFTVEKIQLLILWFQTLNLAVSILSMNGSLWLELWRGTLSSCEKVQRPKQYDLSIIKTQFSLSSCHDKRREKILYKMRNQAVRSFKAQWEEF